VLAKILLFKSDNSISFDVALEDELSNVVLALTSDNFIRSCLEFFEGYRMILSILVVESYPNRVTDEDIRLRHRVGWRRHE
jgi:hypothetical protein